LFFLKSYPAANERTGNQLLAKEILVPKVALMKEFNKAKLLL
jgi:hypothetical protein